jgi:hypothetical protein
MSSAYIINPETNRPVKRGSRNHKILMREGKLPYSEGDMQEEKGKKVLYKIKREETEDEIENKKRELDQSLQDKDRQAVRGRGQYKDSLVERYKPPPVEKVMSKVSKISNKVQNTQSKTLEDLRSEDLDSLELFIAREIIKAQKQRKTLEEQEEDDWVYNQI